MFATNRKAGERQVEGGKEVAGVQVAAPVVFVICRRRGRR